MAEPTLTGSGRSRWRYLWLVPLGAGLLAALVIVAAGLQVATTREVTVVNGGTASTVRLSTCVDDALDLEPGQSSRIQAPKSGKLGCDVFIDQQYAGCFVLNSRKTPPVSIVSHLERQTSQSECERIS